jgi:hypothetical protein
LCGRYLLCQRSGHEAAELRMLQSQTFERRMPLPYMQEVGPLGLLHGMSQVCMVALFRLLEAISRILSDVPSGVVGKGRSRSTTIRHRQIFASSRCTATCNVSGVSLLNTCVGLAHLAHHVLTDLSGAERATDLRWGLPHNTQRGPDFPEVSEFASCRVGSVSAGQAAGD